MPNNLRLYKVTRESAFDESCCRWWADAPPARVPNPERAATVEVATLFELTIRAVALDPAWSLSPMSAMLTDGVGKQAPIFSSAFRFDNSYARLPAGFYTRTQPTPVRCPRIIKFNQALASELGIAAEDLETARGAQYLAGNQLPDGAEPIALAYAGHQFGNFVPQLGDGRAILLGEVIDRTGSRRDVQLKGSGPTPFSRNGDGRATLASVLREYLLSEAMHALGIPTTRALAAVVTGERVYRERPLPGAVLTRVASSHIRVGTFQYFAARGDTDSVKRLADYVIERHYPALAYVDRPYLALLDAVMERQAKLVARWMHVGFVHGVMNTDNLSISGETIDFGPCAFMNEYDLATVFSSIDLAGRYAYGNQALISQWNLARFAETILPLIDSDPARAIESATNLVATYSDRFKGHWLSGMRRKVGFFTDAASDATLIQNLLDLMQATEADFTLTFRHLANAALPNEGTSDVRNQFRDPGAFDEWASRWQVRLAQEPQSPAERAAAMRRVNPRFIPRNHRVERALTAAVEADDLGHFEELLTVLSRPYEEQPQYAHYAEPPGPEERAYVTYCGT